MSAKINMRLECSQNLAVGNAQPTACRMMISSVGSGGRVLFMVNCTINITSINPPLQSMSHATYHVRFKAS